MRKRLATTSRWLYPGMRVKRWMILSLASTVLIVLSLLMLVGKRYVGQLYSFFIELSPAYYILIGLAIALGIAGFLVGVRQLVNSIAQGLVPKQKEKPAELIYRTRILERGPDVVALGGGTGLSVLLRGLKQVTSNISAVVTVMDDGGSSGRLRSELDVLPPGDIRNCVLALAEDEQRVSSLFQYRFQGAAELTGHSLGNLLLVGMEQATGGFDRAIEEMSTILNVRGRVLPATVTKTHLVARMEDGGTVSGESAITADPRRIRKIHLAAEKATAYSKVIEAIRDADLILLGPGSLYTSLIPNLLVDGIAQAIEKASAEKLYIANLMTQPGETEEFTLADHLRTLQEYIDMSTFDAIVVNTEDPSERILVQYEQDSAKPVRNSLSTQESYGLEVIKADLMEIVELEGKLTIKHNPAALADMIVHNTRAFSRSMSS